MPFNKIDIKVNGEQLKVDIDDELQIGDLSTDMAKVAAQIAYWGAVWAAAEAEQESVDAHYRKWRAEVGQKIMAASDGKAAEWKVKQEIEANADFIKFKEAAAKALQHSTLARSVYEAFRTKASILQSQGARERAELAATGMSTRTEPDHKASREERERDVEAGVSAMREANRKKRRE